MYPWRANSQARASLPQPDPVERVLSLLDRPKRSNGAWLARCPAHEDRSPSLSIGRGDDGRCLLHCHAGCSVDAVLEALGLRPGDLFAPTSEIPNSKRRQATSQIAKLPPRPTIDFAAILGRWASQSRAEFPHVTASRLPVSRPGGRVEAGPDEDDRTREAQTSPPQ